MTDFTQAQALAFIDALEAENNAAAKPCPDLASWIVDCRASPETLAWEAARWDSYDGDHWEAATFIEYSNGQLAVVVAGEGSRGVVMLADGLFYPVTGDPSDEWSFYNVGDDDTGYATLAEAQA